MSELCVARMSRATENMKQNLEDKRGQQRLLVIAIDCDNI